HVFRIDRKRPLKLLHGIVELIAVLIKDANVVVDLRAHVVLFEQRAVVCKRAVKVADALEIECPAEMILGWRRRTRGRLPWCRFENGLCLRTGAGRDRTGLRCRRTCRRRRGAWLNRADRRGRWSRGFDSRGWRACWRRFDSRYRRRRRR